MNKLLIKSCQIYHIPKGRRIFNKVASQVQSTDTSCLVCYHLMWVHSIYSDLLISGKIPGQHVMRHSLLPGHQLHSDVLQTVCARTMENGHCLTQFPFKKKEKAGF